MKGFEPSVVVLKHTSGACTFQCFSPACFKQRPSTQRRKKGHKAKVQTQTRSASPIQATCQAASSIYPRSSYERVSSLRAGSFLLLSVLPASLLCDTSHHSIQQLDKTQQFFLQGNTEKTCRYSTLPMKPPPGPYCPSSAALTRLPQQRPPASPTLAEAEVLLPTSVCQTRPPKD